MLKITDFMIIVPLIDFFFKCAGICLFRLQESLAKTDITIAEFLTVFQITFDRVVPNISKMNHGNRNVSIIFVCCTLQLNISYTHYASDIHQTP